MFRRRNLRGTELVEYFFVGSLEPRPLLITLGPDAAGGEPPEMDGWTYLPASGHMVPV
jgi:hypothetical protein